MQNFLNLPLGNARYGPTTEIVMVPSLVLLMLRKLLTDFGSKVFIPHFKNIHQMI
jgi:hypothetical protein